MVTIWLTIMKPTFTNEWLALSSKEVHQVLEKIKQLEQDPTPDAKVLTLNSAKGLEFPIVALSGFINSGWYGNVPAHVPQEEKDEFLAINRRTIFVGITRAMRALLIIVPAQTNSPLLQRFDRTLWNVG
jgi:superfamily I DNA/RNA helicase